MVHYGLDIIPLANYSESQMYHLHNKQYFQTSCKYPGFFLFTLPRLRQNYFWLWFQSTWSIWNQKQTIPNKPNPSNSKHLMVWLIILNVCRKRKVVLNVRICVNCGTEFYLESSICYPCRTSYSNCRYCNSLECEVCDMDFDFSSTFLECETCSLSECTDCSSAYYLESGSCLPCGFLNCDVCTSIECTRCNDGFVVSEM